MKDSRQLINASKEHLAAIEVRLMGVLRPIAPPSHFVEGLRKRIHIPEPRVLAGRQTNLQFIIIIVGGVVSVAVLAITTARALFYLFRRKRGKAAA